jgi:hypothetical protein
MAAKRKIGIKAIKKALSDSIDKHHDTVWYKIVSESDLTYKLRRTNELIHELLSGGEDAKIDQAITLLGLIKARFNETVQA